ncbi:cytochrome c-type biogenesis protein CcmH [Microvirga sp. SRT01]|uniref:Cytochrome c-type biogenesis protein n=1 Tax=Sphingomonas longa TaxID=2778730 RepID=A0ABS2DBQ4_9SPHN|nr:MULTISPECIES: cytochrome c-type biogenesis protein [Alphaproteobacteria]MBM6578378.1 cytochrome c-type biogenesis protein CcmH [Sphingomonas sp. BT552]MBR7711419.1 cytochrome c-type biogenesis protein CcmH [Microvirga sp. SRT01]
MKRALLLAAMFAAPVAAQTSAPAAYADTQLADPAQEAQARGLMETLRCVVCQGQSIADSDAQMAGDMRALVRQRIRAGERPEGIRNWLIGRYGDYISYDPPFVAATAALWLAPVALLLAGVWIARGSFRKRRRA